MILQKIPSDAVLSHSRAPWLIVCLSVKHKSQPFPSQFSPAFNVWKSMTLNQMNSSRFEKVCVKMYPHADELRTNRIEGRRGREQSHGMWSYPFPGSSATMCKQQVYAQGKELKAEEILKLTELYGSINRPCSLSKIRNQMAHFFLLTLFALPEGSSAWKHLRFD